MQILLGTPLPGAVPPQPVTYGVGSKPRQCPPFQRCARSGVQGVGGEGTCCISRVLGAAFILLGVGCQLSYFWGEIPRMGNAGFVAMGIGSSARLPHSCFPCGRALVLLLQSPLNRSCRGSALLCPSGPPTFSFSPPREPALCPPLQGVQIHE